MYFNVTNMRTHIHKHTHTHTHTIQGTPAVTETFIDSRKEVDTQLKNTCEQFIHGVTERLIGPLRDFVSKVVLTSTLLLLSKRLLCDPILEKDHLAASSFRDNRC